MSDSSEAASDVEIEEEPLQNFEPSLNSIQNTQASFLLSQNQEIKKTLRVQFTDLIKEFIPSLKSDRSQFIKPFEYYLPNNKKSTKFQKLVNEEFYFDFIPTFILVDTQGMSFQELYRALRDQNPGAEVLKYIDEKKALHKNYITFKPNTQLPFYFKIKELPFDYPKQKEADVLIDKFFEFHLTTIEGFYQFAAYIFHWAHNRGILNQKYIPISALKIILIQFSIIIIGSPSLISQYLKKFWGQLQKMDDYISLGPQGTQVANKKQINGFPNAVLEERKGFFLKSQNAYDKSCKIRKIPFPIIAGEIGEMKTRFKSTVKPRSTGQLVYSFFKLSRNLLVTNKVFKIDFTVDYKKSLQMQNKKTWSSEESQNPCLIILHPVFGYNITQHLEKNKDKTDFNVICEEFTRGFDYVKTGKTSDLWEITEEYKDQRRKP